MIKRFTFFGILGFFVAAHAQCYDVQSLLKCWYDQTVFTTSIQGVGFISDHTPTTFGVIPSTIGSSPRASDLAIYFAKLGADTTLSDWFKTNLTLGYTQRSPSFIRSPPGGGDVFFVDKAYIAIQNPHVTPIYFKFGRQFIPFGGLDSTSVFESTTQLLSLSRFTFATLGLNYQGFDGSFYMFRGLSQLQDQNTTQARNFGASVQYGQTLNRFDYLVGGGYLNNIAGALYTQTTLANNSNLGNNHAYTRAVAGLDLHANFNFKPFDAGIKYIDALSRFTASDVPYTTNGGTTLIGAKPAAWGVNAGYSFPVLQHPTRAGLGYQGSSQAVALGTAMGSVANATAGIYGTYFAIGLPRNRYYANYLFTFFKGVGLTFEVDHDIAYGSSFGGTGKQATIALAQLAASV